MKAPMEHCPNFELCSAPKCPLDPNYHLRDGRLEGEEVCKAQKRTRLRIAGLFPHGFLPYSGYTGREYSGLTAGGMKITKGASLQE